MSFAIIKGDLCAYMVGVVADYNIESSWKSTFSFIPFSFLQFCEGSKRGFSVGSGGGALFNAPIKQVPVW